MIKNDDRNFRDPKDAAGQETRPSTAPRASDGIDAKSVAEETAYQSCKILYGPRTDGGNYRLYLVLLTGVARNMRGTIRRSWGVYGSLRCFVEA